MTQQLIIACFAFLAAVSSEGRTTRLEQYQQSILSLPAQTASKAELYQLIEEFKIKTRNIERQNRAAEARLNDQYRQARTFEQKSAIYAAAQMLIESTLRLKDTTSDGFCQTLNLYAHNTRARNKSEQPAIEFLDRMALEICQSLHLEIFGDYVELMNPGAREPFQTNGRGLSDNQN